MLSMRSSASAQVGDGEPVRAYPACFAFRVVAAFRWRNRVRATDFASSYSTAFRWWRIYQYCQAYQITKSVFCLHFFGKLLDHFRVLNIAALGGHRHQQVLANQPRHQLCFARVKPVEFGKMHHVLCTENGVVAATPFGDIVKQRGDENQLS